MFEISYWEMFAVITIVWVIVRANVARINKKVSFKRELQLMLVYVCLVVIARMVYFPLRHVNGQIDLMRFDSSRVFPIWFNLIPIVHLFDIYDGWLLNIIGNVTMFIPVGIVWPICFKELDTVGKTILAGAGYTLLIEISQLPLYDRCSDIDDIIMNTTGVAIGALITFGIRKLRKKDSI